VLVFGLALTILTAETTCFVVLIFTSFSLHDSGPNPYTSTHKIKTQHPTTTTTTTTTTTIIIIIIIINNKQH
jgi:hypothetical protein